jgi:sugar-specific transcriptional regulator TrmB
MTDPLIQKTLESLGLNDKEIVIYLMMLQVGTAPASTLGERTGIQRSTAQYTCQQLAKSGIVRMLQKGNTYLYTPEPPEKLLLLLEKQKMELTKKEEQVHRIVGNLKGMMNPHAVLPKIRFFEGKDGVIEGYTTVMKSMAEKGTILSFLHALDEVEDQFGLAKPLKKVTDALRHKEITNWVISPKSKTSLEWQKQDEPPLRLTRLLPPAERLSPVEIMIFNDSLFGVTVERDQIFGYIVENKTITHMHRLAFLSLWEELGKKKG